MVALLWLPLLGSRDGVDLREALHVHLSLRSFIEALTLVVLLPQIPEGILRGLSGIRPRTMDPALPRTLRLLLGVHGGSAVRGALRGVASMTPYPRMGLVILMALPH